MNPTGIALEIVPRVSPGILWEIVSVNSGDTFGNSLKKFFRFFVLEKFLEKIPEGISEVILEAILEWMPGIIPRRISEQIP